MIPWPWPAPVDDGAAAHLERGRVMPDLALSTASGRTVSPARLEGWAVLFVYPWTGRPGHPDPPGWDDIPGAHGSTLEIEGFRNLCSAFRSLDAEIFGLSSQPAEWQREMALRLGAPFEFISDEGLALARALGLPTFTAGGTTYLKRLTLMLKDARIERVVYPVHPPDVHARDMLAWLTDEVGYALEARINAPPRGG